MPQATVISVADGVVKVRVRRSHREETLYQRNYDLSPGERIEVKRQVNNPYPIFIGKVSQ